MMARLHPALARCVLVVLAAAASGCAAHDLHQAKVADDLRDYDVAVANYMKVLRTHPDNTEALQGLERAKLRASEAHLFQGRRLTGQGRSQDAVLELQIAVELSPANVVAEKELRAARARVRAELTAPAEGPTPLEALLARASELQPAGTELPDVKLPAEIATGSGVSSRALYQMLARLGSLSLVFDADFQDTPAQPALLSGMTLKRALDAVGKATSTFAAVTSPNTITVAPDNATKRREYTDDVLGLLVVQNADMKETMDALRTVADMRNIAPVTGLNMITVRDTPERYRAAARLLAAFDKARPQVVVDIEVIEVDRAKLREYSLQIASPGSPGIDGQFNVNREGLTVQDLRSLGAADILATNVPALYYRLIKTDTRTRFLANPHISMIDGTTGVASFGQDVPVRRTVITPITQGGLAIQPQVSYEYKTIGVNISITPRTHPNDEVTLNLNIDLSSIAGASADGPTFGKRNVTTTIRLRDGETNILAGLIRDEERTERESIPGLGNIPVLGTLFSHTRREVQQTDVVIMLTPHIVRGLTVTEDDLRPFRVPRDGSGADGPSLGPPPPPRVGRGGGSGTVPTPFESFPVTAGLPQGLLPTTPLTFPTPPVKVIKN